MKNLTSKEIIEILVANYSYNNIAEQEWLNFEENSELNNFVFSDTLISEISQAEFLYEKYKKLPKKTSEEKLISATIYKQYSDLDIYTKQKKEIIDYLGLGDIKCIDSYGGEDCGSDYWKVLYFSDHDVYIKIEGYYQSYSGSSFEIEPYEVKPKEKTITVYESI